MTIKYVLYNTSLKFIQKVMSIRNFLSGPILAEVWDIQDLKLWNIRNGTILWDISDESVEGAKEIELASKKTVYCILNEEGKEVFKSTL